MTFPATYNGWIAYLRDWLSADEYSDAQIASFIDLAQLRLNREMTSYGMEADTTINFPDANPIVITSSVADFSKVRLVNAPGVGPLESMALNEIKKELAKDDSGEPIYYCIDAGKLYISPAFGPGDLEFFYYKKIPYLSSTVPTNVFSIDHPDALLYASLLAAAPYMKDEEDIPVWESAYTVALMTGNADAGKIKLGSTPLVRRPARAA